MTTEITILIILGIFVLILLIYIAFFKNNELPETKQDDTGLKLILQQLNEVNRTVDQKLTDVSNTLDKKMDRSSDIVQKSLEHQMSESQKQYSDSQRIIQEITRELVEVKEGNKQVRSFADQLQSLQDILKNPKQRGILGEYYLETLLKNIMPPGSFEMQYKLGKNDDGNDLIPDAVVFIREKIIPIDSKFSLENYNRITETSDLLEKARLEKLFVNDLKSRITETAKYVRPDLGTMDFAFMFIPHEAIYYDLLINKIGGIADDNENLIQRAAGKYRVIIVSPTSFLAYLQTVLQGLKALQIEEKATEIMKHVGELGRHIKSYEEYHGKLGNNLNTVVNQYNLSSRELKKIDKDVLRITGESAGIEIELLDKPDRED